MIKKINMDEFGYVNMSVFNEVQKDELRKTKELKIDEYGEFVKLTHSELNQLFNKKEETEWSYTLSVDYEDFNPDTYNGVVITRHKNDEYEQMIKINSGEVYLDEELALNVLSHIIEEPEISISYSSSYDDYLSDLLSDIENMEI